MNGIAPVDAAGPSLGDVARAHESLNAAYSAIAADRIPQTLAQDARLARGYVHEARAHLYTGAGHSGTDAARAAARAVLPRLDHALRLLDLLATTRDQTHVQPLLDELGAAMDRVESVLAGAGWD
ncbi:MAG: hypothetical protein JWL76_1222 [Thermoleophilia bacterium]|nr:hypothetical protein [Thermoleophilia bacterium]